MELATSVSRAYGIPLLRLQCYQGINEEKAIGQYDKSLQELYVLLMSKSDHTPDWVEIKRKVTSRAYFIAGPLLEAIEQNQRCVLLIDEIDKVTTLSRRKPSNVLVRASDSVRISTAC